MTEEEMIEKSDALTDRVAELASQWKNSDKTDDLLYMDYQLAMWELNQWRNYWRSVGVAVDDSHPGSRPSHGGVGIQVRDNTEA